MRVRLTSRGRRVAVALLVVASCAVGVSAAVAGHAGRVGADQPGVPADASSAPDQVSAAAIAAAYGHRVEVTGLDAVSSTTYTKVVDSSGTTTDYYKTTVAPDGSIVHVKIKFP